MRLFHSLILVLFGCIGQLSAQQWLWANRTGSSIPDNEAIEEAYSVETNANGDIFVLYRIGVNNSPAYEIFNDNDTTWIVIHGDAFVSKYDSTGHRHWSRPFLTRDTSSPFISLPAALPSEMVLDSAGNIYITGMFTGTNILVPGDTINSTTQYQPDMFVMKLDSAMNLIWMRTSTRLNALNGLPSESRRIAVDRLGNVYCGGYIRDSLVFGGDTLCDQLSGSGYNAFFAKFDNAGSLLWSRIIPSPATCWLESITCDYSCNVYVTGSFAAHVSFQGDSLFGIGTTGYILKVDQNGNLAWIEESISALDLAIKDSVLYAAGALRDTLLIDTNMYVPNMLYGTDAVIARLDLNGLHHGLMRTPAASSIDRFTCVKPTDSTVLVGGDLSGTMILDSSTYVASGFDIMFAEFDMSDSLNWITFAASDGYQALCDITCDADGRIYVVGSVADSFCQLGNITMDVEHEMDCFFGRIKSHHSFCGFLEPVGQVDTGMCSNSSVQLSAPSGFMSYLWSSGQTTQSVTVNSPQTYTYFAIDSSGCYYQGPAYNLIVEPEFQIWLSVTGDTIFSSESYHIEWLLNGAHVASNNTGSFVPTIVGWYCAVDTTSFDYCGDTSNCVYWNPVSIDEYSIQNLLVYPNPATDVISFVVADGYFWEVTDLTGRVIQSEKITGASIEVTLAQVPNGIYVLRVTDTNGRIHNSKFTIQR